MRTPFCNLQLTIILTCIPPLSSLPAIPSTSSIISTCFLGSALWPDKHKEYSYNDNVDERSPLLFSFKQTLLQISQKALAPYLIYFLNFPSLPHPPPPLHSKVGGLLFPTGSSNSGITLHGVRGWGVGPGAKPYFPLFKSANYQKGFLE